MSPRMTLDQPGIYRIRVQGRLGSSWLGYFDDLEICVSLDQEGNPITVLTGELRDQGAVQGTLQKLYNLGFPLISAEKIYL